MVLKQPLFQQNDTSDQAADVARFLVKDLMNDRPGIIQGNAMRVVQRSGGANNSVDIGAGAIIIPGTAAANQGHYYVVNDATVNLPMSTAAHGSLPRIDTVIVKVRDGFYSGSDNDAQFVWVAGTAAASPTAPDITALGHTNFWRLANISVPANDNTVVTADITDVRTSATISPAQGSASAVGGCIICTSTARPALPRSGQLIWETDTKRLVVNEGSPDTPVWQPVSQNNAWTTFTPSFTGLTVGTGGSTAGRYMKLGRLAFATFEFALGSSGFSVPSLIEWVPPSPIAAELTITSTCSFAWANNSGGPRYGAVGVKLNGETRVARFASNNDQIGWGSASGGIPFAWGATDQFKGMAIYETAA